jgi:2-polyprenyl-6-methoxyphenol hydroxylase-like FAD-dependent oxidoreductase
MAREFGRNRCWLAGDAAHQTGPVGVQSMNAGFFEGEMLANTLGKITREKAPMSLLENYNRQQQAQWKRLLNLNQTAKAGDGTDPWVAQRTARLLPCLPGLDQALGALAQQLKLTV